MKKPYKQLTADERDEIAIFMAREFNLSNIAGMTEDEAQRSRWTFYEVVKFNQISIKTHER